MKLIVLMGSPGSGKGTIANMLISNERYKHLSTGKIFRDLATKQKSSDNSNVDLKVLSQGKFVSDDVTNQIIKDEINKYSELSVVILDGYPRTIAQAEFLDKNFSVHKVIYLSNISDEILVNRLCNRYVCRANDHSFNINNLNNKNKCPIDGSDLYQRSDDSEEVIYKRLEVYRTSTMPVIEWYKSKSKLFAFNASEDIDDLYNKISASIQESN